MTYEVLYYVKGQEDPLFRDFKTLKQAMSFYNSIKNNSNYYDFWVTKRDKYGDIVDDIIY